MSPGVWTNFLGMPCVWNCMMPIGRQCASGLSLLLPAVRFFSSSEPYGVSGRPSLNVDPISRNVASGSPVVATGGGAPRCPVGAPRQTPEKSGFPSAVRGAGALRLGSPAAVFGT